MTNKTLNNLIDPLYEKNIAIISNFSQINYKNLNDSIEKGSELLSFLKMNSGDTVSIALDNNIEFIISFLSITNATGIAAPLNPAYTKEEFKFFMEDSKSKILITSEDKTEAINAANELNILIIFASFEENKFSLSMNNVTLTKIRNYETPSEKNIALFLHTSGTTSRPKGVPLTHRNLIQSLENISKHYSLTSNDKSLIVMPLFHVHGLIGAALSTLYTGGTIIIQKKFSASTFWSEALNNNATWYSAVPTIHQILLSRADKDNAPHSLFRFIRSCSAALAPVVFDSLEKRFGAPVLEAYGMTEAAHQMSSNPLPPKIRKSGTVGLATGVEIGIMNTEGKNEILKHNQVGEVVIKGENVTLGYNNKSANTESFVNGWFKTGDQGIIDKDNYLSLTGRIKELINRGGEKISPLEVDAILLKHPDVLEAVSFGVPDEKYGESVQAAVVINGNTNEDSIKKHCLESLADFKVPDIIHISKSLPRTATGKLQRRIIAKKFGNT